MSDSVTISYIMRTHTLASVTAIGSVLINYLIDTKTHPNANIVFLNCDEGYVSLYSYDLFSPISTILNRLYISKDNFINESDKMYALQKLQQYILAVRSRSYEENELLEAADHAIETLARVMTTLELTHRERLARRQIGEGLPTAGTRDSVKTRTPVERPITKKVMFVEEEEEEMIPTRRIGRRIPTVTTAREKIKDDS